MSTISVNAIARVCHEANRALCLEQGDVSQLPWNDAPAWQRQSAIAGVIAAIDNPDITPEMMHDKWREQKMYDGWIYGEVKNADTKTHPCMIPYDKLPQGQQAKDHLFLSIVQALTKVNDVYGLVQSKSV